MPRMFSVVSELAQQRGGLLTSAEAERAGVTPMQLSRMAASGYLVRLAQGVYRATGAPEHEATLVAWLGLGGATRRRTETGAPAVVAAGETAAVLHHIGDLWPHRDEFIVPARRLTRRPDIKLRVATLEPADVAIAPTGYVPTLTVERTIADLLGQWVDLSLVADTVRDAHQQGKITRQLPAYLEPLARPLGYTSGDELLRALLDYAGLADLTPA